MNRPIFRPPAVRLILIVGGFLAINFGFFCQSDLPGRIILKYFSHDRMLNPETVNTLILAGAFSGILGLAAASVGLFRPAWIERAAAMPRSELLYGASLFGTGVLLFLGLALGIRSMRAYVKILAVVAGGAALIFARRKLGHRIAPVYAVLFNRWLAFVGYVAASCYFLLVRFPLGTFGRFLFSRDYPMFQYTVWLDYKVLKQGYLYGWEPHFPAATPPSSTCAAFWSPTCPSCCSRRRWGFT